MDIVTSHGLSKLTVFKIAIQSIGIEFPESKIKTTEKKNRNFH